MPPRTRDLLALGFCMTFPSLMSWLEFWVLPGSGSEANPLLKWVFALGKIVQFAFPALYVWLTQPDQLGVPRASRQGMGPGVLFALVVAAGIFLLYFPWLRHTDLMAQTGIKIRHWLTEFSSATPGSFLAIAAFVAVPHSLLEEYYWRWFVFGWLKRHMPVGPAVILSSLAFMSHHIVVLSFYLPGYFWSAVVPFSLCVAGGGVAWAWLYHRGQTLYAPWISHLLVDVAIMVAGYDMLVRAGM